MKNIILLLVTCLVSFFLLSYRITEVPPGINGDEAGIGYNAALISKNLTDETGNFLPLFIFAKSSDWKQPITIYATALVFRVFGITYFNLRATSILFILVSMIILYFISKEVFSLRFFIVSSLFLITAPIILIQSHLGLENVAPLPFIFFWLWMLIKYEKTGKNIFLIASGISLGVGLFSYLGMRLIVPVLAMISVIYFWGSLRKISYFLVGLLPFFLLLFWSYFHYPGAVFGSFNSSVIVSPYDFLYRYLSSFDFSFLFFDGDITSYHSTGRFGMLLLASLPLFLFGFYKIMKTKNRLLKLVLVSFFSSPIFFGLISEIHRASRLVALLPFYIIIATFGFLSVGRKVAVLAVALIMVNYWFFASDYWLFYPGRVKKDFSPSVNVLQDMIKKGVDSGYKYWSSVQFLEETNGQK